jgi:predicted HTH domain antitoxin
MITGDELAAILRERGVRIEQFQGSEFVAYMLRVAAEYAQGEEKQRLFRHAAFIEPADHLNLPPGWQRLCEELEGDERYAPLRPLFDLWMDSTSKYLASRRGSRAGGSRSKVSLARKAAIREMFRMAFQRELKHRGGVATQKDQADTYNAAVRHTVDHADPGGKRPNRRTVKNLCPNPFDEEGQAEQ